MIDPSQRGDADALLSENAALRAEVERLTFELGHRVRNTLGVVQALASQTLRTAATPQEATETLSHRVLALARANDAILQDGWTTAGLATVARRVLEPDGVSLGPLTIAGPDLAVHAAAALSFCMALHELATNARRAGAWSVPDGRVSLAWEVRGARPEQQLHLAWVERGGGPAAAPARKGFGLRLIEQSLRSAFGRDVAVSFEAEGFACRVVSPLCDLLRTE